MGRSIFRTTSYLCLLMFFASPAEGAVPTPIFEVPYEITKPGRYVLTRSRSYTGEGFAIAISADNVLLDLQDWTLSSAALNPAATLAEGIRVTGHKNVTIRNGTLRGFFRGIYLVGSPSAGNCLIENMRVDGGTFAGIQLNGNTSVIRRCRVANLGGSTAYTAHRVGIEIGGSAIRVLENDVSNVFSAGAANVNGLAYGIRVLGGSDSAVITGNRVLNDQVVGFSLSTYGIHLATSNFSMVSENQISQFATGLLIENGGKNVYRDNTVTRSAFPYTVTPSVAGKDGGGNVSY